MEKAIEVKNLCKNYRVYDSKSSRIRNIINPFAKKEVKEFKALTDVSFHVNKGEIEVSLEIMVLVNLLC